MRTYTQSELDEAIRLHGMWIRKEDGGVELNLMGATLPTGETYVEYLEEVVPALVRAVHYDFNNVAILLRPRAEQFKQLHNAEQIPMCVYSRRPKKQ